MVEPMKVHVLRGGRLESRHDVHAIAVRDDGRTELRHGEPRREAFWRSSMKPFQALPLVEDGVTRSLDMSAAELALCCASHDGSREHVDGVLGLLRRQGLDEEDLACGPHRPFDSEEADRIVREAGAYGRIHNNCSGKHAGMLSLALHHGWETEGYHELGHPVQARIRASLDPWLDRPADSLGWGVDGCGVPTPYLALHEMATAYARLARAANRGDEAPAAVVAAMTARPKLVSGVGRPVTRIMEATSGRILAKEGAEGVFCMAAPEGGLGFALKVVDGARRASAPAAVGLLAEADLLRPGEARELDELRSVVIENTRGEAVGRIVAGEAPAGARR